MSLYPPGQLLALIEKLASDLYKKNVKLYDENYILTKDVSNGSSIPTAADLLMISEKASTLATEYVIGNLSVRCLPEDPAFTTISGLNFIVGIFLLDDYNVIATSRIRKYTGSLV